MIATKTWLEAGPGRMTSRPLDLESMGCSKCNQSCTRPCGILVNPDTVKPFRFVSIRAWMQNRLQCLAKRQNEPNLHRFFMELGEERGVCHRPQTVKLSKRSQSTLFLHNIGPCLHEAKIVSTATAPPVMHAFKFVKDSVRPGFSNASRGFQEPASGGLGSRHYEIDERRAGPPRVDALTPETPSDATLLERFVTGGEEAAFAALVRRHGPRVERICRRILGDPHEAEDVLQATFLVLSLKADRIAWHESVRPWLEGVARRLAMHARSATTRRRVRERTLSALSGAGHESTGRLPERFHPRAESSDLVDRRDVRQVIDDELGRLPEKYRAPVVLCDLEGHTREEAARRLGWPTGSMSRRLDRARSLLRHRLAVRGVALAFVALASIAAAAAAIGFRGDRPSGIGFRSTSRLAISPAYGAREVPPGHESLTRLSAMPGFSGSRPDFDRIIPAATRAATAARRLKRDDDGPMALVWNLYAADMERSATDLEGAWRASDLVGLQDAARRLDASCINCHAVFRVERTPSAFIPRDSVTIPQRVRAVRPARLRPTGGGLGPTLAAVGRQSLPSDTQPVAIRFERSADADHPSRRLRSDRHLAGDPAPNHPAPALVAFAQATPPAERRRSGPGPHPT